MERLASGDDVEAIIQQLLHCSSHHDILNAKEDVHTGRSCVKLQVVPASLHGRHGDAAWALQGSVKTT